MVVAFNCSGVNTWRSIISMVHFLNKFLHKIYVQMSFMSCSIIDYPIFMSDIFSKTCFFSSSGIKMNWVDLHHCFKQFLWDILYNQCPLLANGIMEWILSILYFKYIISVSNEIIFLFYNSCFPYLYPLCSWRIVINPFGAVYTQMYSTMDLFYYTFRLKMTWNTIPFWLMSEAPIFSGHGHRRFK